jgi:putative redox protein
MKYQFEEPIYGKIGTIKYRASVQWRNGQLIADEPVSLGGTDSGPDPYTLLLSSIASCTLITLRMYIDRKQWNVPEINVNVNMYREEVKGKMITTIDQDLIFPGEIEEDQKTRLIEISKHCPIAKILEGEIKIRLFQFKDKETEKKIHYANNEITVVWKPEFCQHSGRCWSQLPEVFDYTKRKWINPDGSSSDRIIEQVKKCPSGALSFFYNQEK